MTQFRAGVALRDITPAPGVMQWGFSARTVPATGTLDPLHAKVVVFEAGGESVALVALDLGRVPPEAILRRIRHRVGPVGVQHVMFHATHTHHGPVMEDPDAPHMPGIERAIVCAIEEAASRLQPARIGIGHAEIDIGHNRRKLVDDKCYMVWRNEERVPTGPVDKQATLIRIDALSGDPIATLVHYACHPVVLGPTNLLYTGDYVGTFTRLVSEATSAPCLFIQGACGDINPYLDKTPSEQNGPEAVREVGAACAEATIPVLRSLKTSPPDRPGIGYEERMVHVGTRWDFSDPEARATFQQFHRGLFDRYVENLSADLEVPLTVLLINRELALVGVPGEPPIHYQLDFKVSAPVRHGLVCGYTNGYHAYFPSVRDALAGGYGGTVASYVGLGAGEKLLVEAKIEIARLLGKGYNRCTSQNFAPAT